MFGGSKSMLVDGSYRYEGSADPHGRHTPPPGATSPPAAQVAWTAESTSLCNQLLGVPQVFEPILATTTNAGKHVALGRERSAAELTARLQLLAARHAWSPRRLPSGRRRTNECLITFWVWQRLQRRMLDQQQLDNFVSFTATHRVFSLLIAADPEHEKIAGLCRRRPSDHVPLVSVNVFEHFLRVARARGAPWFEAARSELVRLATAGVVRMAAACTLGNHAHTRALRFFASVSRQRTHAHGR